MRSLYVYPTSPYNDTRSPAMYSELAPPDGSAHFNGSHQDFIDRTQQIFMERGYQKVTSERHRQPRNVAVRKE